MADDTGSPVGSDAGSQGGPQTQPSAPPQPSPPSPASPPSDTQPMGAGIDNKEMQKDSGDNNLGEINLDKMVEKKRRATLLLIAAGIIVVAVLGFAGFTIFLSPKATTTVPVITTTGPVVTNLASCGVISKPGIYAITQDIYTQIAKGSCILITSSNVRLLGNQHSLYGQGPFVQVPPFTYAIALQHVSNVVVGKLNVSKFSYGIYFNGSSQDIAQNITLRNITMAGVYFYNSRNNLLFNSKTGQSQSDQGSVYMVGGGNNTIQNSSMQYNQQYGAKINSTHNVFANDTFVGNPVDFICVGQATFRSSNKYTKSTCYVNEYCNFAFCAQNNIVSNVSAIQLTSNVNSCGSISIPGTYTLGSSLFMGDFVNTSYGPSKHVPCITIKTPNVKLDCKGNGINNAPYGIISVTQYNLTIRNCNFNNDTYGIYLANLFKLNLSNVRVTNSTYSVYLLNASYGNVTNVTFLNNKYGMYFNTTSLYQIIGYHSHYNKYGTFMDKSNGLSFLGGDIGSDTKADFYCSVNEYNYTTNLFQNTACGTTDCKWANPQCPTYILPSVQFYPINNCTSIITGGNYSLTGNVYGLNSCLSIKASRVNLNCKGYGIFGKTYTGSAIIINNQSNVSIQNCAIATFGTGAVVSNSKGVALGNVTMSNILTGVNLYNVSQSTFSNVSAMGYQNNGFVFNAVSNSVIVRDTANASLTSQIGFWFINSKNNKVSFNNATSNRVYGFAFNKSAGNAVFNNTAYLSNNGDYFCSPDSAGLDMQTMGINYGGTKVNCAWLAELSHGNMQQCYPISITQRLTLTQDMVYVFGQTCFNVFNTTKSSASDSIFDCQGRTVLATNGGTFINITGGSRIVIRNCYLKGFTVPIVSRGQSINIINNTISYSNLSIDAENSAANTRIINNTVLKGIGSGAVGIYFTNTSYSIIKGNKIGNVTTGLQIGRNSNFNNINNNTINNATAGITLNGSIQNTFGNNYASSGFYCYGISNTPATTSHNLDFYSTCSKAFSCPWLSSQNCR